MDTIQKYIEPFSELYEKLDFASFFSAYWYAQKVTQPMDLPILSAALENLKRKWYEEVEINPETVLMDKKRRRRCKHEIFLRTVYMLEIVLITKNSL